MAKRFYEPVSGDLTLWADPRSFVKADLEAEVLDLEVIINEDDIVREKLGNCAGYQDLEDYDDYLNEQWSMKKDQIDFFDYLNTTLELTVKDGKWFTPDSVYSVCGADVGYPADNTIDGDTATYWEHDVNEQHEIIWQLRSYKKRMSKINLRIGSSSRNLLTGLDIYIADNVGGLYSVNNKVASGLSFSVANTWEEIEFPNANGKYIRFANFGSSNVDNWVRIQEIEIWVKTVEYD